jgi:hypothetical protein
MPCPYGVKGKGARGVACSTRLKITRKAGRMSYVGARPVPRPERKNYRKNDQTFYSGATARF